MDSRVLEGVLEWASTRSAWQQEAIRRLLDDHLDEDDIAELAELCVAEHKGDLPTGELEPLPASEDVTPDDDSEVSTGLVAISNVEHVNALAAEQVLPFNRGRPDHRSR